jgi:hypothetical protein
MKKLNAILLPIFILITIQVVAADLNFTVGVPDGWTKRDKSSALAQYKKSSGSFIITADYLSANASTPDTYITFVKGMLGKAFEKITYEQVVSGKKDGFETRELKYVGETSGIKIKYDVLYIFNNGKAYTLTGGNMSDFYDEAFSKDIKAFFASFKFN